MAAETTETPRRQLFNSSANGGADGSVGSPRGAADPVPARRAASSRCKKDLESRRKRGSWTAAEDAELRAYVAKYGVGNWKHVAEATPALKRDAQSCRLRWSSYLDPKVSRAPFTPEEDARLLASVVWGGSHSGTNGSHSGTKWAGVDTNELNGAPIQWGSRSGTKWAVIASAKFPSRTGYQIQSRWHSLVNKQRQRFDPLSTTPKGRPAGNTTITTTTVNPSVAVQEQSPGNTAADTIVTGTGGKEVPFLLEGVLERSDLTSGRRFWSRGESVSGLNGEIAVGVASIPVLPQVVSQVVPQVLLLHLPVQPLLTPQLLLRSS
ncbi:unnamed protein product [Closterium sp. NIES-53]